jgi:hypothetical protein
MTFRNPITIKCMIQLSKLSSIILLASRLKHIWIRNRAIFLKYRVKREGKKRKSIKVEIQSWAAAAHLYNHFPSRKIIYNSCVLKCRSYVINHITFNALYYYVEIIQHWSDDMLCTHSSVCDEGMMVKFGCGNTCKRYFFSRW